MSYWTGRVAIRFIYISLTLQHNKWPRFILKHCCDCCLEAVCKEAVCKEMFINQGVFYMNVNILLLYHKPNIGAYVTVNSLASKENKKTNKKNPFLLNQVWWHVCFHQWRGFSSSIVLSRRFITYMEARMKTKPVVRRKTWQNMREAVQAVSEGRNHTYTQPLWMLWWTNSGPHPITSTS